MDPLSYLLFAILLASVCQPSAERIFAAVVFITFTLVHEVTLSSTTGFTYYGTAALFNLLTILFTSGINPLPKMVLTLHRICLAAILVNAAGWVMWFLYMSPAAYNALFFALYVWVIITLIHRTGLNVGGLTMDRWHTCFCFNRLTWSKLLQSHGIKV